MSSSSSSVLQLQELDSLTVTLIVDNELDIFTPVPPEKVQAYGNLGHVALQEPEDVTDRGECRREIKMGSICCAALGLSVLMTARKGDIEHSLLFDTGPDGTLWKANAKRLKLDLAPVEVVFLSHWHRDHSGGMLDAIHTIKSAKKLNYAAPRELVADLHPARPDYRGFRFAEQFISMEADPSFPEIDHAGGKVDKQSKSHTVLDDMFLVSGEIPRQTSYEIGLPNGVRFEKDTGGWKKDEEITDERFVVCNVKDKGLVVLTGCSHAGVVNTSRHAVSLVPNTPLHAVLGGYHLANSPPEQIAATISDLEALEPDLLMPGHCTGWKAKFAMQHSLPGRVVPTSVGMSYTFLSPRS
ncbi:metallo-beta-lactamase superfamily protein [Patellaria atrata CBS 101060]|uniref:Metallo-beta-lactamase superfamily protein n=1 Tax=Patellaria atrata CBS 101060 TaxID=1346257 RepID=A0A9P4VPC3_9PEZI|nr:metallo-beta-lactamase superfamily protein [Patellaria atrata CBS 101060]